MVIKAAMMVLCGDFRKAEVMGLIILPTAVLFHVVTGRLRVRFKET